MKKIFTLILCALPVCAFAKWSSEPETALPAGTNQYANEYVMGADGSVWNMIVHPNLDNADSEMDTGNVKYQYWVQRFDPDGNKQFNGEFGLLVSQEPNISYTVVNNYMHVDTDGNLILAVSDQRNSSDGNSLGYTVYKISPKGEFLWGDEGISLDDGRTSYLVAAMDITQLEDGSYVFAWTKLRNETTNVVLQRLSKDGETLWGTDTITLPDPYTMYPYLVNSGMNQFILVYARSEGQNLYAQKYDFDGTPVWANHTRIYTGGWGSIPLWTKLHVVPSGDGGALLSWNDDREFTNFESAFVSYITTDGQLGFSGASPLGDVKVGYGGWKCYNCFAVPASDGDGFIALWRETDSSQAFQQLAMQHISKSGELLWDENGVVITETIEDIWEEGYVSYLYLSLQPGNEGQTAAFYMTNDTRTYPPAQTYSASFTVLNNSDGSMWDKGTVTIDKRTFGELSNLQTLVNTDKKTWIAAWEAAIPSNPDDRTSPRITNYYIQKYNFDGETAAVEKIETAAQTSLSYNGEHITIYAYGNADVDLYDMAGIRVANLYNGMTQGASHISTRGIAPGLYVVKANLNEKTETLKIAIR